MTGDRCQVLPLNVDEHVVSLFHAFNQDTSQNNWTYLPYGPFATVEAFADWLEASCGGDDPMFHSVMDNRTGAAVGLASFMRITPSVGVMEVGHIHFSPLIQRTAVSTEAMFLMMRRVFDELGYRRYEWKCDSLNAPSRSAALRLGFQFEGIFRQATVYRQRNRDTAWFSIIDSEWPVIKTGFERWLSSDNFDADDRQKQSLQELRAS